MEGFAPHLTIVAHSIESITKFDTCIFGSVVKVSISCQLLYQEFEPSNNGRIFFIILDNFISSLSHAVMKSFRSTDRDINTEDSTVGYCKEHRVEILWRIWSSNICSLLLLVFASSIEFFSEFSQKMSKKGKSGSGIFFVLRFNNSLRFRW